MWCACTVIATEKVPKGPRSVHKDGEVHSPIYDVVRGYSARQCTMSARGMHYAGGARSVGRQRSRGAARGGDRERLQDPAEQVEQVSRRGRVAARPRPHLPRQAAPHRQRVQSARLRSAAARYLSLLGLDLQRPGCAAHSARAAEPRRAQREGAALRPGPNLQFCDFWLPGADSESEGSDADEGET